MTANGKFAEWQVVAAKRLIDIGRISTDSVEKAAKKYANAWLYHMSDSQNELVRLKNGKLTGFSDSIRSH